MIKDRFGNEITAGTFVSVQRAGVYKVYEVNDELVFTPYGVEELVRHYFQLDLEIVENYEEECEEDDYDLFDENYMRYD